MDLAGIRSDLKEVARRAGFSAWDYEPDDPSADLPAAVVGGIEEMVRLNRLVTKIQLGVKFYANAADPEDATRTLDSALSVGVNDAKSYLDWLEEVQNDPGMRWRSVAFVRSGPYQRVQLPGNPGPVALSVEIVLELTA